MGSKGGFGFIFPIGSFVLPSFSCRKFSAAVEVFLSLIFCILSVWTQVSCVLDHLVLSSVLFSHLSLFCLSLLHSEQFLKICLPVH